MRTTLDAAPESGSRLPRTALAGGFALAVARSVDVGRDYGAIPEGLGLEGGVAALLGAVAAAAWIAARVPRFAASGRAAAVARAAAAGFIAWAVSGVVDRGLADQEARLFRLPGWSDVAAGALSALNVEAHAAGRALHVGHPDGLLTVVPTFEKTAARTLAGWFAALSTLLWLAWGRRAAGAIAALAVAAVSASLLWFVAGIAFAVQVRDVLVGDFPSKLSFFWDPWRTAVLLAAATIVVAPWTRERRAAERVRAPGGRPGRIALAGAAVAASIMLWKGYVDPGRERTGRVLVDDVHSESWEPSARTLDPGWYGDYSTYNLNALVQHLGRHFAVTVNVGRALSDELLADVDVLILKTPVVPFTPEEVAAAGRFCERGGGVLLIGDHTNLLWMSSNLNQIAALSGLSFRFDMLSTASTGSFNRYWPSPLDPEAPEVAGLKDLEWMTSCTVDPGPRGRVILGVPNGLRQDHDYGESSFFGATGHDPRMEVGRQALVAEARYGAGRMIAVADSTCFSSFSYYLKGHDRFILNCVASLNRGPAAGEWPRTVFAAVALAGLAFLLASSARPGRADPVAIAFGLAVGGAAALAGVRTIAEHVVTPPPGRSAPPRIVFVDEGTYSAYPPTLGGTGDVPPEALFDTLYAVPVKLGWEARVESDRQAAFRGGYDVAVIVNPVEPESPRALAAIRDYVVGGGTFVLVDRREHGDVPARRDILGVLGLEIRPVEGSPGWATDTLKPVPAGDEGGLRMWSAPVGQGRVVVVVDSDFLSRRGIGHNFGFPTAVEERRRDAVRRLLCERLGFPGPMPPTYRILE